MEDSTIKYMCFLIQYKGVCVSRFTAAICTTKNKHSWPGMVVHAYNSSYSEIGGSNFGPVLA
jgi:hypothetical protein